MKCPECGEAMKTKDTRQWRDNKKKFDWVERRRVCACGYRVMTIEMPKGVWDQYSDRPVDDK